MRKSATIPVLLASILLIPACGQPVAEETPAEPELPDNAALIRNVRVVDFSGAAPVIAEAASILVADGRILEVYGEGEAAPAPAPARVVEANGMTAIPGLYDMHVHVWDEAELPAYLASGVTTVRNMSGMPFHLELQARLEAGALEGPRLLTTGPILNSHGPNEQINHQIVETADEARAAVQLQYDMGFRDLKLYSNVTREAYDAILEEKDRLGMTVSGHSPEGRRDEGIPFEKPFNITFEEVLEDGFLTLEHVETIVWHGLMDSHETDQARALAQKIAASKSAVTTTLLAHHNLLRVAETKGDYARRPGVETLNPFIQQFEQAYIADWSGRDVAWPTKSDAFFGAAAKIFQEEGVVLVAGSDAGIFTNIPGASLIEEVQLLHQGGLSPFEALKTAVYNPAQVLGEADAYGRIAKGYVADMAFYACDPLAGLECLSAPEAVMKDGTWHDRARLDALGARARETNPERTMQNVLSGLAAQGNSLEGLAP